MKGSSFKNTCLSNFSIYKCKSQLGIVGGEFQNEYGKQTRAVLLVGGITLVYCLHIQC